MNGMFFKDEMDDLKSKSDVVEEDSKSVSFDENRFQVYAAAPENVPEDVVYQIADLFDGNEHFKKPDGVQIGPNTVDKIKQSLAVVYIVEKGIPVAASILMDPTVENYKGIVPKSYYELKSGKNLNMRIFQEYFEVSPDYHNLGLAQELKNKLEQLAEKMFVIVPITDKDTQFGLKKNGYFFVSQFETDWEETPVQLWVN